MDLRVRLPLPLLSKMVMIMDNVKQKFLKLRKEWFDDTAHLSSPIQSAKHPAYQQVIGMGPKVVPFLIQDQLENGTHWFWALQSITGENPIQENHRGNIEKMANDWNRWWESQLECPDLLE